MSYRIYFVGVLNIGEKLNKSPIAKIKSSPINLPVRYINSHLYITEHLSMYQCLLPFCKCNITYKTLRTNTKFKLRLFVNV